MSILEVLKNGYKNYGRISGRISRGEYWSLFWLLGAMPALGYVILKVMYGKGVWWGMVLEWGVLGVLVLGFWVPLISAGVRRLHDIGRSGWWIGIQVLGGVLILMGGLSCCGMNFGGLSIWNILFFIEIREDNAFEIFRAGLISIFVVSFILNVIWVALLGAGGDLEENCYGEAIEGKNNGENKLGRKKVKMGFFKAGKVCYLKKYADSSGRATRREYFGFMFFSAVLTVVIGVLMGVGFNQHVQAVILILMLIMNFLPWIAAGVRRLHDIGRSGWWIMLKFIVWPLAYIMNSEAVEGPLVVFVFSAYYIIAVTLVAWIWTRGDRGANEYGADPRWEEEGGQPESRVEERG